MILGFHVIMTAYGFWLPNDPRGSWSTWIRRWELLRFGPATKVTTRRSVAHRPHDRGLRLAAKEALMYPEVSFTGEQAREIGAGFAEAAASAEYRIWAASILRKHVHLVIGRHVRQIQQIVPHLKSKANAHMAAAGLHPFQEEYSPVGNRVSPWTRRYWKVYLNDASDIRRAIDYVRKNPVKEGLGWQRWYFEVLYVP